jgi:PKD repeat protein
MRNRKIWFLLAALFLVFILLLALIMARPAIPAAGSVEIDPRILAEMAAAPDGTAGFLVLFREQADLAPAYAIRDRDERGRFVVEALQATAGRSQARVRAWLDAQGIAYRAFISDNSLFLTADLAVLNRLAAFPEVAGMRANYVHPVEEVPLAGQEQPAATIPWNIAQVGADQVWQDFGIKGQGIVVATIDTGAEYTHDALFPNYKCGAGPHADCWYDPTNTCPSAPCDNNGHGTFLTGILAGDDDPGLAYNAGMAPDAQWIVCKGCTDGGACTDADLNACADWLLAPNGDPGLAPNVIVLALSSSQKCDGWFLPQVMAWQAAGIYPVARPGSAGPACDTMRSVGSYEGVLTAGATDQADTITSFSSRGPGCGGGIKPDVVAPGVDICSTYPGNSWTCGYSGTSWATAHAAGLAALLYSADPGLIGNAASTTLIITSTALCLENLSCGGTPCPDGANNVYGWGRIDAYAAVASVLQPCDPVTEAGFTWEPLTPTASLPITLTASATGTAPISFTWDLGDGATAEGEIVTHTYDQPSIYTVILTATNCGTATAVVSHSVTVQACEPVALADFSWTPTTPTAGQAVTLTAAATGTAPLSYTWDLGDGTVAAGMTVTHAYAAPGTYSVVFTATNCQGQGVATATHTITVACPPVTGLSFAWEPLLPTAGQVVTLTAAASSTLPLTYTWVLGDGTGATGATVTHTYAAGTYTVTITATNGCAWQQVVQRLDVVAQTWEFYLPLVFK